MVVVKALNKCFTVAAMAHSKLCQWDEDLGMVMSMQDCMLEGCDDEADPDYDITSPQVKILGLQELLDSAAKPTEAAGLMVAEQQAVVNMIVIDDATNDSILTFHNQAKTKQKRLAKKKMQGAAAIMAVQPPQVDEMMTIALGLTLETVSARLDTLSDMLAILIHHIDPEEMPQASPKWKKTKSNLTDP